MTEQEASPTSSAPTAPLPWWVKVCRLLWRVFLFVWGTLVVNTLIGTLANLNTTTTDTPLTKLYLIHIAVTYPLLTAASLGTLALLTLLSWRGSHYEHHPTPSHSISEQDRAHMLRRLRLRYDQMLAQSLQGAVQVELGMASRPAAVQNAASLSLRLPDQPEHLLPSGTSLIDAYEQAQQELLILGEPGTGKSTLLLELAHHLVEQAKQDATQPLPIVVPLSTWATKRGLLQEWLAEQFAQLYDVPRSSSQQWIEAELVLPLLDGLDEMEEAARPACISAINTYHRDHLRPLVVCSRTSEYDTAVTHERLALHTAVVVQPLSPTQVDAHLETLGKPLAALRKALKTNSTLRDMATTPLLLQVLMLTYHGIAIRELPHKEAQLQEQIWADYVQRMVERKGDMKYYPLRQTIVWLGWLAQQMREHNQTIFYVELLQPDWLLKGKRALYQWSVGLFFGLLVGLLFGLFDGLLFGLFAGLLVGLEVGLAKKIKLVEVGS